MNVNRKNKEKLLFQIGLSSQQDASEYLNGEIEKAIKGFYNANWSERFCFNKNVFRVECLQQLNSPYVVFNVRVMIFPKEQANGTWVGMENLGVALKSVFHVEKPSDVAKEIKKCFKTSLSVHYANCRDNEKERLLKDAKRIGFALEDLKNEYHKFCLSASPFQITGLRKSYRLWRG